MGRPSRLVRKRHRRHEQNTLARWILRELVNNSVELPASQRFQHALRKFDDKATERSLPTTDRHAPFLGRRLDCQIHHLYRRLLG